jgi:hypothetical protein
MALSEAQIVGKRDAAEREDQAERVKEFMNYMLIEIRWKNILQRWINYYLCFH